jgi:hypothetical protein
MVTYESPFTWHIPTALPQSVTILPVQLRIPVILHGT